MRCTVSFLLMVAGFSLSVGQYDGSGIGIGSGQTGSSTDAGRSSGTAPLSSQNANPSGLRDTAQTGQLNAGKAIAGGLTGFASNPTQPVQIGNSIGSFAGLPGIPRPAGSTVPVFTGVRGSGNLSGFNEPAAVSIGTQAGTEFQRDSQVIQQQVTPTVTQTITVDQFTTLTDTVFQSYQVTLTQFKVTTTTRPIQKVVVTPVNDILAISTTVLTRPEYVTVTETKTDFNLFVKTSITHVTLTHSSYNIRHVPFTLSITETVHLTSPVVRTVISTSRFIVTNYHTVINTHYIHAGY